MADIAKITLKGESEAKNFIDEALRGDIAYEELSTTVSKTGGYVAGDHLIYLGQYYEVVADIAQGGTIVTSGAGQNVEEREVGDEIKKNKTQVDSQIQTLTSAFANNVNENGCKNVLRVINKTTANYANIIYTPNSDGSISVSNTKASAIADYYLFAPDNKNENSIIPLGNDLERDVDYVLSTGRLSNAGVRLIINLYDKDKAGLGVLFETQTHATFNLSTLDPNNLAAYYRIYLRVSSGATPVDNAVIYPMICLKSDYDLDPTYVPPSKTNLQLTQDSVTWDDLSEVGAVNYCPNDAKTQTVTTDGANVTFTVNDDGSVTVNGTAGTSNVVLELKANDTFWENALKIGQTYRLSGCPSGGSDSTYCLQTFRMPTVFDYGDGAVFTFANVGTNKLVQIVIFAGATVSNLTFKPMIAPVSYNGQYVPYAKSNKELTDIVTNKILLTKQSSVKATADGTKTYATLLVEAITALRSVIGNLASNERLKPIRIGIYGLFVMPVAYEIFLDKTNTSINLNFVGNIVSANVYQTIQIQANNTGNIYIYRSDNGIVDRGSEVPTSGHFIEIIYEIYTFT